MRCFQSCWFCSHFNGSVFAVSAGSRTLQYHKSTTVAQEHYSNTTAAWQQLTQQPLLPGAMKPMIGAWMASVYRCVFDSLSSFCVRSLNHLSCLFVHKTIVCQWPIYFRRVSDLSSLAPADTVSSWSSTPDTSRLHESQTNRGSRLLCGLSF